MYAQYEVFCELDSVEGPLKEKVVDLFHRLEEIEAELSMVHDAIKKKDVAMTKLQISKTEADEVIQVLSSDLEALHKKKNTVIEEL